MLEVPFSKKKLPILTQFRKEFLCKRGGFPVVVGTAPMIWAKFDMTFHVRQQVWDQNIRIPAGLEFFSCLPY